MIKRRAAARKHHPVAERKRVAPEESVGKARAGRSNAKQNTFKTEAEITILNPDRMIIKLNRKPHGTKANVLAQ